MCSGILKMSSILLTFVFFSNLQSLSCFVSNFTRSETFYHLNLRVQISHLYRMGIGKEVPDALARYDLLMHIEYLLKPPWWILNFVVVKFTS